MEHKTTKKPISQKLPKYRSEATFTNYLEFSRAYNFPSNSRFWSEVKGSGRISREVQTIDQMLKKVYDRKYVPTIEIGYSHDDARTHDHLVFAVIPAKPGVNYDTSNTHIFLVERLPIGDPSRGPW